MENNNNITKTISPTFSCTEWMGGVSKVYFNGLNFEIGKRSSTFRIQWYEGKSFAWIKINIFGQQILNGDFDNLKSIKTVVCEDHNGRILILNNPKIKMIYECDKGIGDLNGACFRFHSEDYVYCTDKIAGLTTERNSNG
jgi:hypothetical protein